MLGSLVSLATTGHLVGVRNDIYFQPILAGLYGEPQFANDAFIQSLRYYSSGLWMFLSGAEQYIDTYWLLLGLHFTSGTLTFIGFLTCATLLGIRAWDKRLFLTGLLCATSFLRGQSLAGDGGLFINYFTHSELDNGLTLILLYMLLRRWLMAAIVIDGVIFFFNAFIGVWNTVMIIGVAATMAFRGALTWRQVIVQGSVGAMLATPLALPVLHNILTNPDFGKTLGFDYVTYLEEFWPYHFLIWDIGWRERLGLSAIVALGIISFSAFGRLATFFLVAFTSLIAVYATGVIVPYLTHNAVLLNLHLLRSSTMLQLIGTFACLALATRWWFSDKPIESNVFAPLLVLVMCLPTKMTTIDASVRASAAFLVIAVALLPKARQRIPETLWRPALRSKLWVSAIVAATFAVVVGVKTITNYRDASLLTEWRMIGRWARANTSPTDLFLLPTWNFRGLPSPSETDEESRAILASGAFEAISHRAVWIDFRDGAAVMWSPSYYQQWHQRVIEVNSLLSINERLGYAEAHGIKYLIDLCRPDFPRTSVFGTDRLCVYPAS